jgi:hypothetical protein
MIWLDSKFVKCLKRLIELNKPKKIISAITESSSDE